jgi:hypothetical protein
MFVLDLDGFDKTADDFPARRKVRLIETGANLFRKLVESAQHQLQLVALGSLVRRRGCLVFQSLQPLTSPRHARLELGLLQQSVFIGIDQPADAALNRADVFGELFDVDGRLEFVRQSALKLLPQHVRILKYGANVRPHSRVQPIQANGTVLTDLVPVKAK